MKKALGLIWFVREGDMAPVWSGLVYRDFWRHGCWVAPIGLNIMFSLLGQAVTFVRFGFLSERMNSRNWYQQGFDAGVKRGRVLAGLDR